MAAAPVFRASIRVDIGQFVADAHDAAAMMRSRAVAEAALNSLPPASRAATVGAFSSRVTVRPVPATRLVEIAARDSNPDRASDEVTALATAYIRYIERAAGESNAASLAALDDERTTHQRALNEARARLIRQRDAAAAADTSRLLMSDALSRREAAHQRVLAAEPAYRSVLAAGAPPDASPIARDPLIQLLKMRVSVLAGARNPIDSAVALARADLAMRETQLAATIRGEFEGARIEEMLLDEEISALQSRVESSAAHAAAAESTAASIAREEAELEANRRREVELRVVAGTAPDAPRIVDAAVAEDRVRAELAYGAWFAAAVAMLAALLPVAIKNRTPRRHDSAVLAVVHPR